VPIWRGDAQFRQAAIRVAALAAVVLLAAIVNGWSPLVPLGVAAAGGLYAAELAVDDAPIDIAAPAIAAGLYLAAELAFWSLDERQRVEGDPGDGLRRATFVALLGVGSFVVAAALLALADGIRARGLALDLVGAAAAVAALATIALVARERR
jgi:hypothetical protein